jgi:hypothetical protein
LVWARLIPTKVVGYCIHARTISLLVVFKITCVRPVVVAKFFSRICRKIKYLKQNNN